MNDELSGSIIAQLLNTKQLLDATLLRFYQTGHKSVPDIVVWCRGKRDHDSVADFWYDVLRQRFQEGFKLTGLGRDTVD